MNGSVSEESPTNLTIGTIDENGAITNPSDLNVIDRSTAFSEVFIFAHGWWTSPEHATDEYKTFAGGFGARLNALRATLAIPSDAQLLPIGIVWPSMVPAALGVFQNVFEAFSYADVRSRAELIAKTGLAGMIRRIWALATPARQLRIHLLGHSMGCRVVCQALATALLADSQPTNPGDAASAPLARILPNAQLNVVLFEGAIDNNTVERVQEYGILSAIDGLRLLVTRSDLDAVLADYPPDVEPHPAMGAKGPTTATCTDASSHFFDQLSAVSVAKGSDCTVVAGKEERFVVADLTALHKADKAVDPQKWSGVSGSHSDIYEPEIYELTAGFLFPPRKARAQ